MSVYSINQRVFEQASANGSGGKSSSSAADQFLAALNQAGSQMSASAAAAPSAGQAFNKMFERRADEAAPAEKAVDKPKRTEAKGAERKETNDSPREAQATDQPKVEAKGKDQGEVVSEDQGQAADDTAEATVEVVAQDADAPVVTQETTAPVVDPAAVVVDVPQQTVQTEVAVVAPQTTQAAETAEPEKIAEAAPTQKPVEVTGDAAAATDAEQGQGGDPALVTAATQQAAKAKSGQHHADHAAAAQAKDMAANLDDTGANLNVQVKVSETAKPVQPSVGTAEVLLTQDVDGLEIPLPNQPNGNPSGGQGQANAGQTGQTGAAATQDPALMNRPVDAKPFVAALAAAQSEGAGQPQTAGGSNGNQTQAVAGLNGANGAQGATKTAQAQAAQAPRPQQMPQAKEIMDQVKVQIAKQGANGDTIKVQLKPVELGSIEVKLEVSKDGNVTGVVTADNKETLAMLKNDARTLEKALSDAGFKTDQGSLTFNLRGEGQQQTAQDQNFGRRARRAAIAAAGGLDATQAGMAAQAQARFAGGRSGVDIQV